MVIASKDWYHFCVFTLSDYFVQGIRSEPTALAEMKPVLGNFFSDHFSMHMDNVKAAFPPLHHAWPSRTNLSSVCVCVCVCVSVCVGVVVCTGVTMQRCTCSLFLCWTTVPPLHFLPRSYPNLNNLSASLSQTLPRFKCLSSGFMVSWIIPLMVRDLRWPNLPYVYPSRKKCFSLNWAWWLWHLFKADPTLPSNY